SPWRPDASNSGQTCFISSGSLMFPCLVRPGLFDEGLGGLFSPVLAVHLSERMELPGVESSRVPSAGNLRRGVEPESIGISLRCSLGVVLSWRDWLGGLILTALPVMRLLGADV